MLRWISTPYLLCTLSFSPIFCPTSALCKQHERSVTTVQTTLAMCHSSWVKMDATILPGRLSYLTYVLGLRGHRFNYQKTYFFSLHLYLSMQSPSHQAMPPQLIISLYSLTLPQRAFCPATGMLSPTIPYLFLLHKQHLVFSTLTNHIQISLPFFVIRIP
jgi:hypothetical protein